MSPDLLAILIDWLSSGVTRTYAELVEILPEREKPRAFLIQQELKQRGMVQPVIRFENGNVVHEIVPVVQNGGE